MRTRWLDLLVAYRRDRGLTQEALGEILGCTAQTISRWERGRDRPSIAMELRMRSILATGRYSGFDLRHALAASQAMIIVIDDKMRGAATSLGHAKAYGYAENPFIGLPMERSIPDYTMEAFDRVGGVRRILEGSDCCELVLRRKVDSLNHTGREIWTRYMTAAITFADGTRFWISQGMQIAPAPGLIESITMF